MSDPTLEHLIAERDRMTEVLHNYENVSRDPSQLPSDAHEYYGRLAKLDAQIEQRQTEEHQRYNEQILAAKQRGYEDATAYSQRHPALGRDLEGLQLDRLARDGWIVTRATKTFDEHTPATSLLSFEDWVHHYRLGGSKAVQEWYFDQKRDLGLGRNHGAAQAQEAPHSDRYAAALAPISEQKTQATGALFWQLPGSFSAPSMAQIDTAQEQQRHQQIEVPGLCR